MNTTENTETLLTIARANAGTALELRNEKRFGRREWRTTNHCLNAYFTNVIDTCREYRVKTTKKAAWVVYLAEVRAEAPRLGIKLTGRYAPEALAPVALTPAMRGLLAGLLQHDRHGVEFWQDHGEHRAVQALVARQLVRRVVTYRGVLVELVHPVPAWVTALAKESV